MEKLKVKKRDVLILNVVLYMGLSFLFLYLQHAYRHHLSPFSMVYLRKSLELFWYIALPILLSMILIWKHHQWGIPTFIFCTVAISFKVVEGLFIEFNKIIVIALFCYIVISYFLYQLMKYYFSMASLNANYSASDLFDPLLKVIPCQVEIDGKNSAGYLTNWDEEGCFIRLNKALPVKSQVSIVINFHGREFTQRGEVVARSIDLTGVGIKFGKTQKDLKIFNWSEFNELIHELGFKPERLR